MNKGHNTARSPHVHFPRSAHLCRICLWFCDLSRSSGYESCSVSPFFLPLYVTPQLSMSGRDKFFPMLLFCTQTPVSAPFSCLFLVGSESLLNLGLSRWLIINKVFRIIFPRLGVLCPASTTAFRITSVLFLSFLWSLGEGPPVSLVFVFVFFLNKILHSLSQSHPVYPP